MKLTHSIEVPKGYLLAGVYCRIKRDPQSPDLSLIMSEEPATGAGVYTQNRICAAPVTLDRQRTPSDSIRAVVINSGNANACTGERGMADAKRMAELAAMVCQAQPEQVLVLSTGIIGEFLPMDKIEQGITAAAVKLGSKEPSLLAAARGMLTTDRHHKLAGRRVTVGGKPVQITGMAKGAGMIGPNMATMLCVVLTDAAFAPDAAQELLQAVADETFNCISVEGHTSTNDTLLMLANGAAAGQPTGADLESFTAAVKEVCEELARAIASDGEGAQHLITIDVTGCPSRADARAIAQAVANSPLVKTAIAGGDPNWGRIVSAAGYAGVDFDPGGLSLKLNGTLLYENGAPIPFDESAVSRSVRNEQETHIELSFSEGSAAARFWTCDLTAEYVRINADYHT
ncbi:MAG: bifunctional glutamate N-acetyltransferase/amino-acid acetyltransferase ArgJ [Thermoguttaceae bacterium]|jgi:glutamate N-acetyltransferase/amino-acid N-acetyltransferase|nr:bifunctional glutamate N-acetyltransferase/amino-acid acetyltransferase ArgJ [Thermoguttaceae bacterium]